MFFMLCALFADFRVTPALSTVAEIAPKGEHGIRHAETCQRGFYAALFVVATVGSKYGLRIASGLIVQGPKPLRESESDFRMLMQYITCDLLCDHFLNHLLLRKLLTDDDQKTFKYLILFDVDDYKDVKSGQPLVTFSCSKFSPNQYFEDVCPRTTCTFHNNGMITITGAIIKWKCGMPTSVAAKASQAKPSHGNILRPHYPGLAFTIIGIWHTLNTIKTYKLKGPSNFTSSTWFPFTSTTPVTIPKHSELYLLLSFSAAAAPSKSSTTLF
uniref:Uncharacterized protein n=1 Tax=Ananas comosus var. bracteatus TaxID=296719 RepID=A0A6V7P925_ANACO|nr:unnamed protein product [Ananas comosus var. bracteatus]